MCLMACRKRPEAKREGARRQAHREKHMSNRARRPRKFYQEGLRRDDVLRTESSKTLRHVSFCKV